MSQLVRKQFKKPVQIEKMNRTQQLELRKKMQAVRENARNELATNLTLTDQQKLKHVVDYIVGVPLE